MVKPYPVHPVECPGHVQLQERGDNASAPALVYNLVSTFFKLFVKHPIKDDNTTRLDFT